MHTPTTPTATAYMESPFHIQEEDVEELNKNRGFQIVRQYLDTQSSYNTYVQPLLSNSTLLISIPQFLQPSFSPIPRSQRNIPPSPLRPTRPAPAPPTNTITSNAPILYPPTDF
jgi:hypothetical protein